MGPCEREVTDEYQEGLLGAVSDSRHCQLVVAQDLLA